MRAFVVVAAAALLGARASGASFDFSLIQADARTTAQTMDAIGKLQERVRFLARRWEEVQR
jgi:hypothetical protein